MVCLPHRYTGSMAARRAIDVHDYSEFDGTGSIRSSLCEFHWSCRCWMLLTSSVPESVGILLAKISPLSRPLEYAVIAHN